MSTALADSDRKKSLSSSMGDMRPVYSNPLNGSNGAAAAASSDYWTTVSTFIGNFLKRYGSVCYDHLSKLMQETSCE
jgi:hypothetical protein